MAGLAVSGQSEKLEQINTQATIQGNGYNYEHSVSYSNTYTLY